MNARPEKTLITGGAGFIGSHLADGAKKAAADRFHYPGPEEQG